MIPESALGKMYANGKGVAQDYVQAHKWMNLAAAGAGANTEDTIEDIMLRGGGVIPVGLDWLASKNRDDVAARMTPAQIAEAQRLASEWKKK